MFHRTFRRAAVGEVTDTMIGLRGGRHASQKSSRVEICIAVADWARGLMTWVLDVPGGESTGARRKIRTKHARNTLYQVCQMQRVHRVFRASTSRSTGGSTARSTACGRRAGMVVGWG
ncbi:hypothetical protein SZN_01559 [Streptomyces zinciresistens K42]|uniref:Uncharacterized protein n=1 Tax=Streptomyces zinciresistens K42 TaxID=700597 RepID=G2G4B0_9ACTN|nr:hypothetical protein SZN_01559 [Streptomyces zinciresistens K42]